MVLRVVCSSEVYSLLSGLLHPVRGGFLISWSGLFVLRCCLNICVDVFDLVGVYLMFLI